MHPYDDAQSNKAMEIVLKTGECLFDLCKDGTQLRPVQFGSRSYSDFERKYHLFAGEAVAGT